MKIFISMPMSGKSTEQVQREMKEIKNQVSMKLGQGISFIESIIDGADKEIAMNGNNAGVWYLGESIKKMSEANLVVFAPGYREARGCMMEYKIARGYGMFIAELPFPLIK